VWDVERGVGLYSLRGHEGRVLCVRWSPANPQLLFTASDDQTVRCWDVTRWPGGDVISMPPTRRDPDPVAAKISKQRKHTAAASAAAAAMAKQPGRSKSDGQRAGNGPRPSEAKFCKSGVDNSGREQTADANSSPASASLAVTCSESDGGKGFAALSSAQAEPVSVPDSTVLEAAGSDNKPLIEGPRTAPDSVALTNTAVKVVAGKSSAAISGGGGGGGGNGGGGGKATRKGEKGLLTAQGKAAAALQQAVREPGALLSARAALLSRSWVRRLNKVMKDSDGPCPALRRAAGGGAAGRFDAALTEAELRGSVGREAAGRSDPLQVAQQHLNVSRI
jgi:hypothetical protein